MPTAARRGRQVTPAATWVAACAALIVHGILLSSVHALDISVVGEGFSTRARKPAEVVELKSGCVGDALLAGSARFSMCLAPWRADTDACLERAELDMRMDMSSCVAVRDALALSEISMLEPKQADKVTPIDPEPLIEMMKKPDQPPPPELKQQQAQQQPPPPQPPAPPTPPRKMQVVETVKPSAEKEPDNARFLAEYNSSADKQKVSRGAVKEPMVAKAKPEELTPKETPKEVEQAKQEQDRTKGMNKTAPDVPGTLAMRNPGAQRPAEIQQDAKTLGAENGATGPLAFDGFMPRRGTGAFEQEKKEKSEIPKGESGAGGGAPPDLDLKPSRDVLERALGGGSVDHLEDVANDDETALNAKRWVHATFFNRLKRQVAQNWDPASVWRRQDPSGQVYGFKTRITEVRVTLARNGQLTKIVVTAPSGVAELDDEAVRAFQQAAPFVNPPKELANAEGNIVFGFSFYFEIGAPRSSWRVVRSM